MVKIARTTPTITPTMNHSIIVLLPGQGWFFPHGSRIFLSAKKREEFILGFSLWGRMGLGAGGWRDTFQARKRGSDEGTT